VGSTHLHVGVDMVLFAPFHMEMLLWIGVCGEASSRRVRYVECSRWGASRGLIIPKYGCLFCPVGAVWSPGFEAGPSVLVVGPPNATPRSISLLLHHHASLRCSSGSAARHSFYSPVTNLSHLSRIHNKSMASDYDYIDFYDSEFASLEFEPADFDAMTDDESDEEGEDHVRRRRWSPPEQHVDCYPELREWEWAERCRVGW
jgi:hypothetical protein